MGHTSVHQTRRTFLRATGIALALPMLESLGTVHAAPNDGRRAKRLVSVGTFFGFYTPAFFPKQFGRGYTLPPLLKPLEKCREDFTIFSGLDHRAANGHKHWSNYLTGRNGRSVSIDQIVADKIGSATRFGSLELTTGSAPAQGQMCFTQEGVALPMLGRPSALFEKLFTSGAQKERTRYLLDSGHSVLDFVNDKAKSLEKRVSHADREKLGEYLSSVRDVEKRLQKRRAWLDKPVSTPDYPLPKFDPIAPDRLLECEAIMYDLMGLAIQTDSTSVISFLVGGGGQVLTIDGQKLSAGYHGLSHHGNHPGRVADFIKINLAHIEQFARFLKTLKTKQDAKGRPLLDSTIVMLGSGMGNANIHANSNLPMLIAGGGFKHGSHVAIDRKKSGAPLLGDLYITLMQRLGLEVDRFALAKKNMNGLFS
jgi:hypothetical protein